MQVYTHHFVTVDTLMVPPPTGQGLMVRPAFSEQHRLLVPANMLQSEISRCAKHAIRHLQGSGCSLLDLQFLLCPATRSIVSVASTRPGFESAIVKPSATYMSMPWSSLDHMAYV